MPFIVEDLAIELVSTVRPLMPRIRRHSRSLADQLTRSLDSTVLNICEANYSDPGNRRARFYTAAGSANESRGALRLAKAWGYLPAKSVEPAERLLRRILGMLWSLSH